MYNLFNDLRGFALVTRDGADGTVHDVYFDDETWAVRYAVADIGSILSGHQVLVAADVLGQPDLKKRAWPADLSKDQLENAPDPEDVQTVSEQERRRRVEAGGGWPLFMLAPSGAAYTPLLAEQQLKEMAAIQDQLETEPANVSTHIRSMAEICGYQVKAEDGKIGTVDDFLINPLDWRIRHIVVDTGSWLPGKQVVLSVDHITDVSWENGEVAVSATVHQVETSPEPDDISGLTRAEESLLVAHYGGYVV